MRGWGSAGPGAWVPSQVRPSQVVRDPAWLVDGGHLAAGTALPGLAGSLGGAGNRLGDLDHEADAGAETRANSPRTGQASAAVELRQSPSRGLTHVWLWILEGCSRGWSYATARGGAFPNARSGERAGAVSREAMRERGAVFRQPAPGADGVPAAGRDGVRKALSRKRMPSEQMQLSICSCRESLEPSQRSASRRSPSATSASRAAR